MSSTPRADSRVIPAASVHRAAEPVLLDCGTGAAGAEGALAVIPILDGDRVAGLEIRCKCGSNVIVECVYDEEPES